MDIPLPPPEHAQTGTLLPLGECLLPFGEMTFEDLVGVYARQVAQHEAAGVEAYCIAPMESMAEARAAVLAVRAVSAKPIWVRLLCNGDGRTAAGSDVLAALIVLQGMGITAFGADCPDEETARVQLRRLSLHATIPVSVRPEVKLSAALPPRDPDVIPCASETEARFITPDVDVGETIDCTPDLLQDILEAEEERPQGALKIAILEEDDVDILAENQYAVRDALCLWSDVPELLERGLRVYQGRAFWDGTGDLEPDFLRAMSRKYGLILL
ncbi:MAG: homocysteine S-methyltransferase family protein [Pseudoflavonifractor sp.]